MISVVGGSVVQRFRKSVVPVQWLMVSSQWSVVVAEWLRGVFNGCGRVVERLSGRVASSQWPAISDLQPVVL